MEIKEVTLNGAIDRLEFLLLKELPKEFKEKAEALSDEEFLSEDEIGSSDILRGYRYREIKFIGIIEEKFVFISKCSSSLSLYITSSKTDIKRIKDLIKDLNKDIIFIMNSYENISVIHKGILDENFKNKINKEIEEKINNNRNFLITRLREIDENGNSDYRDDGSDNVVYPIISPEIVEKALALAVKDYEDYNKNQEENRQEQEEERIKKAEDNRKLYEEQSEYKPDKAESGNSGIDISGNVLKIDYWNHLKIEFDKPVNKIFSFEEIRDNKINFNDTNGLLREIISRKSNCVLFDKNRDTDTYEETIRISFEGDRIKLDDKFVAKNKVLFIIGRIRFHNSNRDKIELLNKITGMKADLLEVKELILALNKFDDDDTTEIKIPIDINIIDEDNFNVNLFDKQRILSWATLKKYFFENGATRSVRNHFWAKAGVDFLDIALKVGLTKNEIYDNLNKLKLFASI